MQTKFASFYGKVYVSQRDAQGNPINTFDWGDVSKFELSQSVQTAKHMESQSGQNALAAMVTTDRTVTVNITAHDYSAKTLGRYLYAVVNQVVAASGVVDVLGAAAVGESKFLAHINLSPDGVVVATAGAGAGTPLVEGTDFTLDRGTGVFTALTALTNISITYDYLGFSAAGLFTAADSTDYFVSLRGYNKVDGTPVSVDVFRCRFEPIQALAFIDKNIGSYTVKADVLWDTTKPMNVPGGVGNFALIKQVG